MMYLISIVSVGAILTGMLFASLVARISTQLSADDECITSQVVGATQSENDKQRTDIAVSPDGNILAIATTESVELYETDTLNLWRTFHTDIDQALSVSWSPDGSKLAVVYYVWAVSSDPESKIEIWDVESSEISLTLDITASFATWSPASQLIAVIERFGIPAVWDTESGERIEIESSDISVDSIAWSPDGSNLVGMHAPSATIWVWEPEEGSIIRTWQAEQNGTISYLSWSPDGSLLASATDYGMVQVWDINNAQATVSLEQIGSNLLDMRWSPVESIIALAVREGLIFWDTTVDDELRTFEYPSHPEASLSTESSQIAWSPDGEAVFSIDVDGILHKWDIPSGCLKDSITPTDEID